MRSAGLPTLGRVIAQRDPAVQQRATARTASWNTVVPCPGPVVSSRKNTSPGPHDRACPLTMLSPRPDNTNIHCRAGAGCAESVQPAGKRMKSNSWTGVVAETSRGGAGGANGSMVNSASQSSRWADRLRRCRHGYSASALVYHRRSRCGHPGVSSGPTQRHSVVDSPSTGRHGQPRSPMHRLHPRRPVPTTVLVD